MSRFWNIVSVFPDNPAIAAALEKVEQAALDALDNKGEYAALQILQGAVDYLTHA